MASKKKKTAQNKIDASKRTAQSVEVESYYNKRPSWSFAYVDFFESKWTCSRESFLPKMIGYFKKFDNQTWKEIIKATHDKSNKTCHHRLTLEDLTREPRKLLEKYKEVLPTELLFSLRVNNLERIIGFLDNNGVFYLLWYDENHEITKTKRNS